jgi:hypothetical protein
LINNLFLGKCHGSEYRKRALAALRSDYPRRGAKLSVHQQLPAFQSLEVAQEVALAFRSLEVASQEVALEVAVALGPMGEAVALGLPESWLEGLGGLEEELSLLGPADWLVPRLEELLEQLHDAGGFLRETPLGKYQQESKK